MSDLIFPPVCLHCEERTEPEHKLFCKSCFDLFEFAQQNKQDGFTQCASTFESHGPARILHQQIPKLAEGAAAFMAMQFIELNWPKPDLIIPVPVHWAEVLFTGYNLAQLLANTLSKILNCPIGKQKDIEDKTLLLIDEKQKSDLTHFAKNLWNLYPSEIYCLTLLST